MLEFPLHELDIERSYGEWLYYPYESYRSVQTGKVNEFLLSQAHCTELDARCSVRLGNMRLIVKTEKSVCDFQGEEERVVENCRYVLVASSDEGGAFNHFHTMDDDDEYNI